MATLNRQEEERRRRNQGYSGAAGNIAPPVGSVGGGGTTQPTTTTSNKPTSGTFNNLQGYTQNRSPAAYGLAQQLAKGVKNKARTNVDQSVQEAIQNFTGGLSQSTYDPNTLNQIISNPGAATPEQIQQVQSWRTGEFAGPGSLQQAGLQSVIDNSITSAQQDVDKLTDPTQLPLLMREYLPEYGAKGGNVAVDLGLLRRDPTAQGELSEAQSSLTDYFQNLKQNSETEAQRAYEEATRGYQTGRTETQAALDSELAKRRNQIGTNYQNITQNQQQQYQNVRNAAAQAGDITDEQLVDLGLNRQQWTGLQQTMDQILDGVTPSFDPSTMNSQELYGQYIEPIDRALVGVPGGSMYSDFYGLGGGSGRYGQYTPFVNQGGNWVENPQYRSSDHIRDYLNWVQPLLNTQRARENITSHPRVQPVPNVYQGAPIRSNASLSQFVTPAATPSIASTISREQAAALQALNQMAGSTPQYQLGQAGTYRPDAAVFDYSGANSYLNNIRQQQQFQQQTQQQQLRQDYLNQLARYRALAEALR